MHQDNKLISADPSCNPYLAFAVMLKAGLDGIKNKIAPPNPIEVNIYNLSKKELAEYGIELLPNTLQDALACMEEDALMQETLGKHVFERFLSAKQMECSEYNHRVSQWEIDNYLTKF